MCGFFIYLVVGWVIHIWQRKNEKTEEEENRMDYRELDPVGQKLFQLYPDEFGMEPRDTETYIALAVKNYFMTLEQEQRLGVLKRLVLPQRVDVLIDADNVIAGIQLTEADINKPFMGMIAVFAVQMSLRAVSEQTSEILTDGIPGVDIDSAAGMRVVAAEILKRARNSFEPGNMSEKLEAFIRKLYCIVIGGGDG